MRRVIFAVACSYLAASSAAQATVGCEVIASRKGATSAALYTDPDAASEILRNIPLGDIVQLPDEALAPTTSESWIWVRHDPTQTAIWQSGDFGWMKAEVLANCG